MSLYIYAHIYTYTPICIDVYTHNRYINEWTSESPSSLTLLLLGKATRFDEPHVNVDVLINKNAFIGKIRQDTWQEDCLLHRGCRAVTLKMIFSALTPHLTPQQLVQR